MSFENRLPIFKSLNFDESKVSQLKAYVDLLWSSNEVLNLISRQMSFDDLIDNHVIDSLLPLKLFPQNVKNVADFGSGGGLPAVIFAIQFPHIQFYLYEKSIKKQNFLNKCKSIAPNIQVAGEIPLQLKNIDLITARAFKPLDVILDMSRNYFQAGGHYFLLKGRREKIDEELLLAQKKFKNLKVEVKPLSSPVLDVERHVVLI